MRVIYRSYWRAFWMLMRFWWVKLFYARKVKAGKLGFIGKDCGFFVLEKGRATLKGRVGINDHCMIFTKGKLEIGENFFANKYASIVCHDRITIGDNVSIGQFVTMLDHDHAYEKGADENIKFEGYNTAPITIGNNVWIANHCTVVRGVTIGNNVVVGANTLVHKDVPDNVVILGVPYKIVKKI